MNELLRYLMTNEDADVSRIILT